MSSLKLALQLEIVELRKSVANSLGLAHDMQAARWFSDVAEALGSASPKGAADLTAQIHRAVRGGAGGPRGVVIVAADGRADSKATAQFHTDLSRLYDLTRRSRFADWSVVQGLTQAGQSWLSNSCDSTVVAGQTCSGTLWEDSSPERKVHVGLNTEGVCSMNDRGTARPAMNVRAEGLRRNRAGFGGAPARTA